MLERTWNSLQGRIIQYLPCMPWTKINVETKLFLSPLCKEWIRFLKSTWNMINYLTNWKLLVQYSIRQLSSSNIINIAFWGYLVRPSYWVQEHFIQNIFAFCYISKKKIKIWFNHFIFRINWLYSKIWYISDIALIPSYNSRNEKRLVDSAY